MDRKEHNQDEIKPSSTRPTDFIVLRTKIHKPSVREEFVNRQNLIDKLEENVNLPLTLISAATGCGKSVTISQWLDQSNHRYGWLSLDDEHNDINIFLTYLVTILKEKFPGKTFGIESFLQAIHLPPNLVASTLINDLDQLDSYFILVLDDYQMIKDDQIHEIINGVLQYPPEHFHLVILTQRDPPLKLAKMRAKLRLNEVRMKDLAFTNRETFDLSIRIGANTTDEQVNLLVEHTDGWVTAIAAGLTVLADGVEFERVIQSTDNRNLVISELLEEVVMKGMTNATHKYLELTALVDRFSTKLINAMVAAVDDEDLTESNSEVFINLSRRRNLFLIPLDPTGEWYRYHHFFRNQIKNRVGTHLTTEMVLKLYKAASLWFEKENLIDEALRYAILSEDMKFAVQIFARHRIELYNNDQIQRLQKLIYLFPEKSTNEHPELLLTLAALQNHWANFKMMNNYLERSEIILSNMNSQNLVEQKLHGEFHSIHSILAFKNGDIQKSISHSEKAMELIPANEHHFMRELSLAYYALSCNAEGKIDLALQRIDQEYKKPASTDLYFRRRILQMRCSLHLLGGNSGPMGVDGAALTTIVSPQSYPGAWIMGIYATTCSAYLNNNFEKVTIFHEKLVQHRRLGWPFWIIHCIFLEAMSYVQHQMWPKVDHCIRLCQEIAEEYNIEPLKGIVNAFRIEYHLKRDQLDQATQIAPLADFNPHTPLYHYYIPQLTEVKLMYRANKQEEAGEILKSLLEEGKKYNNINLLIQTLALQAIIHAEDSDLKQAKNVLNEALLLSENKKIIRPFIDLGDPLYQLLKELEQDKQGDLQIEELLQAFRKESNYLVKKEPIPTGTQGNTLSDRELEILILVTRGYKNLEIAEKLFVSLDTVKKHLYNSYQKLYVKNRVSAIKKVQQLGLVDEE